jgi:hypothetical protein
VASRILLFLTASRRSRSLEIGRGLKGKGFAPRAGLPAGEAVAGRADRVGGGVHMLGGAAGGGLRGALLGAAQVRDRGQPGDQHEGASAGSRLRWAYAVMSQAARRRTCPAPTGARAPAAAATATTSKSPLTFPLW